MARDFAKTAEDIVKYLGGKDNVNSLYHCATRLRFRVNDVSKIDKDNLERVENVIGVVDSAGQIQVVIGNKVAVAYKEVMERYHFSNTDSGSNNEGWLNRAIAVLSGLFQPVIPALAGAGLIKAIIAIGMVSGLLSGKSTSFMMLNVAADGVFYFLPMFIAITAARKFDTNEFLALAIAAALCHPMLEVAYTAISAPAPEVANHIMQSLKLQDWGGMTAILENYGYPNTINNLHWFGIPFMLMHYGYSVIPILFAVWVQSHVQRWVYKYTPDALVILVAPMIVLLIMVPFTLMVVGPIGGVVGNGIAWTLKTLNDFSGMLFGAFVGFFWQIMVIFGVHWSTVPVSFANWATLHYDYLSPITAVAVLGQVGATFAVAVKTRNKTLRGLAISTGITGAMGITEPLIYGVTLRLKKPFLYGCIGSTIGGAIAGLMGAKSYAFAFGGILALPTYLGEQGNWVSFWAALIGMVIAFAAAFAMTFILGFADLPESAPSAGGSANGDSVVNAKGTATITTASQITAPLSGEVIALANINDPAFSSGSMGKGIAIKPSIGELYAPCDGVVEAIFPTKHAIGIRDANGCEIMMHIGLDTVELNGEGFSAVVEAGQTVKAGDVLIRFDINTLTNRGIDLTTPIVIVNSDDYTDVQIIAQTGNINTGEPLMRTQI